ncbi:MAG TPA: acyl-CoA dehydrogenase family protein [Streptosporangiaceae bacterium]|nr:acyl-CoA dehydrogenase family protein [Streptosporangiaceae bacterium]
MNSPGGMPLTTAPYLTEEHHEFRKFVRAELETVILPRAAHWERQGKLSRTGWRELAGRGLLSIGDTRDDFLRGAIYLEELGRTGYSGIRAAIAVHAYMALSYIDLFGTEEQRLTYLATARQGARIAALALSEAAAGSDLRQVRTTAAQAADGSYRINGEKCYVVNGSQADFFVTLVRTREPLVGKALSGASLLIIDAANEGIRRVPQPMAGWQGADICRIEFADVAVSPGCLLGRRDSALLQLMQALNFERLVAGLLAVGGIVYCLDLVESYVSERRVHDVPLSANQVIRHQLADFYADLEMLRHYAYHAAWLYSRDLLDARTASILKLKATELAIAVAQKCVQYHGARGYLRGSAASRLYCDAIGATIAGGASELLRELIYQDA